MQKKAVKSSPVDTNTSREKERAAANISGVDCDERAAEQQAEFTQLSFILTLTHRTLRV